LRFKPAEASALSVFISLLAICSLLAPPLGAWQLNKQEEAAKPTEQPRARVRTDNPLDELGADPVSALQPVPTTVGAASVPRRSTVSMAAVDDDDAQA